MSDQLPVVQPPNNGPNRGCQVCKNACETHVEHPDDRSALLTADEQVLPTLRRDGSRNWLSPSLAKGFYWHRRRWVAYGLIAFFVILPHLRFAGKPYVLFDIAHRQFTIMGHTFYPTDTPLVALMMLMAFFSIMLVTAVAGRLWCGWGCPQTVYLEFLFRPIDRFFSGTTGKGGKPRNKTGLSMVLRFLVYLICCLFLAHTFLSYFVGTDRLAVWMTLSPTEHPVAFLVMGGATVGLLFNFLYFREQFCMIACPYGRFQSVMLDRKSIIVAYNAERGEPRSRGKRTAIGQPDTPHSQELTLSSLEQMGQPKVGDCIECGRCTTVCPTGIDIRDGLQLECIHCTQCIDACDDIMRKVGKPTGLISYTSQDTLAGKPSSILRARTLIYPTLITIAAALFLFVLSFKFAFDARVLGTPGAPFTVGRNQQIQNEFRIRLVNRSQTAQQYSISILEQAAAVAWSNEKPIELAPGDTILAPIDIHFPPQLVAGKGSKASTLKISDSSGASRELKISLVGPH